MIQAILNILYTSIVGGFFLMLSWNAIIPSLVEELHIRYLDFPGAFALWVTIRLLAIAAHVGAHRNDSNEPSRGNAEHRGPSITA